MLSSGRRLENIHIEQQYKGNYHLLATIDGKALKYIIRKGTPEHDAMTKNGLANITDDVLKDLAERFLLPKLDSTM